MRGFPKHINTKADLDNAAALFPAETLAYQKRLESGRFMWQDAGPVGDKEVVKETASLKVVENQTAAGVIERRKLALVEDPGAQFFKMGLKVAEVEEGDPEVTGK